MVIVPPTLIRGLDADRLVLDVGVLDHQVAVVVV